MSRKYEQNFFYDFMLINDRYRSCKNVSYILFCTRFGSSKYITYICMCETQGDKE